MEPAILTFASAESWREWLSSNFGREEGIWLRFYKKQSSVATVIYAEALDEALCFGWIDGQVKRYDEQSYLQKFTPRRARSLWSKRNVEHVARLTASGRMTPHGLKQVELAKADGRWEKAYPPPSAMNFPPEFLAALAKNTRAKRQFATLNQANRYAIAWQLHNAKKPETKLRRMDRFIELLSKGGKVH